MTDWSVYAEYGVTDTSTEVYSELFEALIDHAPGVGPAANGNLSLQLMVEADSALEAAAGAAKIAERALRDLGATATLVGIEVVTEAELDRRQAEPLVPELSGIAEAAGIIGIHKQQVARLVNRGDLTAVQTLAAGPVFVADTVRRFAEKEHTRRIGRPVADLGLSPVERSLLNLLAAAADKAERPATPELPAADQVIVGVTTDSRVRLHLGADANTLAGALDTLSRHKLVRTRDLTRAEQATGDPQDTVVTVLAKGRRHVTAGGTTH
ncbi:hypothetical protein ACFXKF_36275 [Streptomyces scopuliridis]|uniref:hypothetical protein n=1 Tax=Streptomyces scopuliridis TaxID=452529 RepID=UPI00368D2C5C